MTTRTPSRTAWSPEGDDRGSQRRAAPTTRALRIVPVGRKPIRLALSIFEKFRSRRDATELIDARTVGLPIMDRMYKEYALGEAPAQMEAWPRRSVRRTRSHSPSAIQLGGQPGVKNFTDGFLEE